MGSVLTLAVSVYFFIISYRLQFIYLLFVFLLPFMPPYLGFGIGSEGFAISLKRILLIILMMALTLSLTQNLKYISKRMSPSYQQNKIMINLLLLFFAVKVFSLTINSREISQYIMIFMEFFSSVFIMVMTILIINTKESIDQLVKIIFYSYNIVLIFVLIEFILQYPVYGKLASDQIMLLTDATMGLTRSGMYRVRTSFLNSIVLGQYLVILFPMIVAYIYKNNYALLVKMIYLILFIFAIYSTGSRSAILMSVILVYMYLMLNIYRRGKEYRLIVHTLNLIVIGVIVYFLFNYINTLIMNFHGRFDLLSGGEEIRSSTSRALQYVAVYDKIQEAPFFGFGKERNFVTKFDFFAIDNYYFWVILEVGVIGTFIYLLFYYFLIKTALNLYKTSHIHYYFLPTLLGIFIIIGSMFLVQPPDNHIYLYIFAGLICVMKVLQTNKNEII